MKCKNLIFYCLPLLLACELIRPEYYDPDYQSQDSTSHGQNSNLAAQQGSSPQEQDSNQTFQYKSSPQEQNPNPTAHGEQGSNPTTFSPSSSQGGRSSPQATPFVTTSQGNTILVQKTCCPCRSGGRLITISKSQEASHNNNLRMRCSAHAGNCPLVVNCFQWKTQCQNSLCSTDVLNQLM